MTYNKQSYASPPLKVTSTDNYQLIEVKGSYGSMPNGSSSSSSYVYCHVVGTDIPNDIYSCSSIPADAVAETGDSYRTLTPPVGYLPI